MDQRRFDQWTRLFAATTPRRAAARLLSGGALCTALTALGSAEAAGKGDDDDDCRRPGKACKRDIECCSRQCEKRPGKPVGKCRFCPAGTTACLARHASIPEGQCCTAADCGACERCRSDGACVTRCAPGQACQNGRCVSNCTPACAGKNCSDDGCGGFCGACAPNETCEGGRCRRVPDCAGKVCGNDGCGGSCGSCAGANEECRDGACVCTPDCAGKVCGGDGCGGSCGNCPGNQACQGGACACPNDLPKECDGVCFPAGSCCPGASRACYTGPNNTDGVGICRAGTETCRDDGTFGPCDGEVTPQAETCNDQDDDCDGAVDNGNLCPAGRVCRDGACCCPVGQTECGGGCVDTDTNRNNCGACGNVCPANRDCRHGVCTSHVFAAAFGSEGDGDGQFRQPIGIARDAGGAAFVTDHVQNRVQAFAIAVVGRPFGAYLGQWGTTGSGDRQFNGASGIGHGGNNVFFVADTGNHRVHRNAGDNFITAFGTLGDGPGQFRSPEDVTAEILGDFFYVADTGNHRVQKIRFNGQHIWTVGGPAAGTGNGQFDAPSGVALDSRHGHLYVADTGNYRIQKFDLNGVWLNTFGTPGNGNGQLNRPQGMAVGGGGGPVADEYKLYVVDSGNDRVQVFRRDGSFYTTWGRRGGGNGEFRSPDGLIVDGGEGVFVVDTGNNRVQKFSPAPA